MRWGRREREGGTEEEAVSSPQLCWTCMSWGLQAKLQTESCEAEGISCNSSELQAKLFNRENCTRAMYRLKYFKFRE